MLTIAGNTRVKMMRNVSSLIQMGVLLLCIDLLVGFFVIERLYDDHQSAGWMTKSIYGMPVLFTVSIWWMRRAHRRSRQDSRQDSAEEEAP